MVFILVAVIQARRVVSPDARLARTGFTLWWGGLGVLGLYGIVSNLFLDPETFTLAGYRVILYTFIPIIFTALAGLVYYLLYLYTGKRSLVTLVAVFYAVLTVAFVLFVELQDPFVGPDPDSGESGLQYANEAPSWAGLLFSLALILPPFAAAVAYFALIFRTKERTVRYRILMVSGGIVLWMGFSLLGSLTRFATGVEEQGFTSQIISQILGLLAAAMVLLAYYPPPFLRRAAGLEALHPSHSTEDAPVDLFRKDRGGRLAPTLERLEDVNGASRSTQYSATASPSRSTKRTVPAGGA